MVYKQDYEMFPEKVPANTEGTLNLFIRALSPGNQTLLASSKLTTEPENSDRIVYTLTVFVE